MEDDSSMEDISLQDVPDATFSLDDMEMPDLFQHFGKLLYHFFCSHSWVVLFFCVWAAFYLMKMRWPVIVVHSKELYQLSEVLQLNRLDVTLCLWLVMFGVTTFAVSRPKCVYLVDFSCLRPPDRLKAPILFTAEQLRISGNFDEQSSDFQKRILERSGLGDHGAVPEALYGPPFKPTMSAAREEAQMVIFGALDELFAKNELQPKDVSILVVNCSMFSPIPSLCSTIINKYKMRPDIDGYNLSGMGCSAGLIAIDAAKDLLRVYHDSYALVVSTEIITPNLYRGKRRSMMIANCLFRIGGAAVLLSNRRDDKRRARYQLQYIVRTHKGAEDKSYGCIYQEHDEEGELGVNISKDLTAVAGDVLKANIRRLGPRVLPVREQLRYAMDVMLRKLGGKRREKKPYVPDLKLAFEHVCIHPGGKAVIDELQRRLELPKEVVEASRMTLHRFGNTSSSSIWYELAYSEAQGRVKKGDRVWQIGFGSGFKCNSAVWKALASPPSNLTNPWNDCIHQYPLPSSSSSPLAHGD